MNNIRSRPSRCLITGASGFIGKRLCEYFEDQAQQAFVPLVRDPRKAQAMLHCWPQLVVGDLLQPSQVKRALQGCDAVVHLAHGGRGAMATRTLIDAARAEGIRRFVHISTMAVHGPRPGPEAAREESATIGRYGHGYSDSKAEQEELVQAAHARGDIEAVILRPTVVYGPGSHFVNLIIDEARGGVVTLFDGGAGVCNPVFVDDLCRAIDSALRSQHATGQAMFINGDENISWGEFIKSFAFLVEPRPELRDQPSAPALDYWKQHPPAAPASLGQRLLMRVMRLAGQRPEPAPWPPLGRIQRETFPVFFMNDKAKRLLDWAPQVDFTRGVAITQTWLASKGALP